MKGLQTLAQRPHTVHMLNMMTSVPLLSFFLIYSALEDPKAGGRGREKGEGTSHAPIPPAESFKVFFIDYF